MATTGIFKLLKSESIPLTIEVAQEFADMDASPTERELNPARVKHLMAKAENGLLVSFNWSKVRFGNRTLRMNGQHSSQMLIKLNGSFPQGLMAHIDEYEVTDVAGLGKLFRQFDDRKSSRSVGDIAGAYQGLYPAIAGLDKKIAKLAIEGYSWYRKELIGIHHPSGDDMFGQFSEEGLYPFITWICQIFSGKCKELQRKEIVAAMYQSWYMNPVEADKFWSAFAIPGFEGYDDDSPEVLLGALLVAIHEKKKDALTPPSQYYQACAYAWNARREGKTIREIKYDIKKGLTEIK